MFVISFCVHCLSADLLTTPLLFLIYFAAFGEFLPRFHLKLKAQHFLLVMGRYQISYELRLCPYRSLDSRIKDYIPNDTDLFFYKTLVTTSASAFTFSFISR